MQHRLRSVIPLFAAVLSFVGCRGSGPDVHHVSGTVTFDGKPVPAGRVDFFPDFSKGNDGPQGFALIKNGKFDTRLDGQGTGGGPVRIRVEGYDGVSDDPKYPGKPIFVAHEVKRDLPKAASVQTLDVPADAAKGLVVPVKSKS